MGHTHLHMEKACNIQTACTTFSGGQTHLFAIAFEAMCRGLSCDAVYKG